MHDDSTVNGATPDVGSTSNPGISADALKRLWAVAEDPGALEMLDPVEVPDWAEELIEQGRPAPSASLRADSLPSRPQIDSAPDIGVAADPPPPTHGRILRFTRRRVLWAGAALAAAAVALFALSRPPTPRVPVDRFSVVAPIPALHPPPLGGSSFVGEVQAAWPALELGYRFALMDDYASGDAPDVRYAAIEVRKAWREYADRWAITRGLSAGSLALDGVEGREGRLRAVREVLDLRSGEGFDLGRWLYLAARHRVGVGPPPPMPQDNTAALRAWVDAAGSERLRAALDGLVDDPTYAPLDFIVESLVGVRGIGR